MAEPGRHSHLAKLLHGHPWLERAFGWVEIMMAGIAYLYGLLLLSSISLAALLYMFSASDGPSALVRAISEIDEHWKGAILLLLPLVVPSAMKILDGTTNLWSQAPAPERLTDKEEPQPVPAPSITNSAKATLAFTRNKTKR